MTFDKIVEINQRIDNYKEIFLFALPLLVMFIYI